MIATRLARALRQHGVQVAVLEDPTDATPGVLCLDPDIHAFHRSLGVDSHRLLHHLPATLRYGTLFTGVCGEDQGGFAGFGSAGQLIERVPFQHYVTALRSLRPDARLADFSPAALAAHAGGFALDGSGPLAGIEAGMSVERDAYLAFLRALGGDLGVETLAGTVQQVEHDHEGEPNALLLDDGRRVSADLYFDCGGQITRASRGSPVTREPFPARISIGRPELSRAQREGSEALFDQLIVDESGWQRLRCVGNSVECERVWTREEDDPAAAHGAGGLLCEPWRGRRVALGPALGEPEDLVADRWLLTRRALSHWLRLLPTRQPEPKLCDEFNRVVVAEARRVADAQCLPLVCAAWRRPGWGVAVRIDDTAAADLRYRLDLYRSTGRLSFHEDDPLPASRWMMLLEALGVLPEAADRLLPVLPPEELAQRMDRVSQTLARAVAALPAHTHTLAGLRQATGARA